MNRFLRRRIHTPLRHGLIGERYSFRRRRGTFTGQHPQPFYPGDPSKHPGRAAQVTACLALRRAEVCPPMLQPEREHGTHPRPNPETSRIRLAWPLRRRRLPFDAGYIPRVPRVRASRSVRVRTRTGRIKPRNKFLVVAWPHRLRLSRRCLRLTPFPSSGLGTPLPWKLQFPVFVT